ncbi:hypothetical protein [Aliikangiella coralliicola]|uniref:Uncharacterized protein n=1 Tax=Aliikangiella coralliicola TaxID=2592383 RepID=A0A545UG21_9GAMM|nr:hypothetical protein [Aliikangiella coralliicola]TQV88420.1 hypothetical protein FLL46_07815 [Aliikangiella coralliicola]
MKTLTKNIVNRFGAQMPKKSEHTTAKKSGARAVFAFLGLIAAGDLMAASCIRHIYNNSNAPYEVEFNPSAGGYRIWHDHSQNVLRCNFNQGDSQPGSSTKKCFIPPGESATIKFTSTDGRIQGSTKIWDATGRRDHGSYKHAWLNTCDEADYELGLGNFEHSLSQHDVYDLSDPADLDITIKKDSFRGGLATPSRVGALDSAGNLFVKEGDANAAWKLIRNNSDVDAYQIENKRVAIKIGNSLYVSEDALVDVGSGSMTWTHVAGDVRSFQLEGNRIGVLNNDGSLHVKEGALNAPWFSQAQSVTSFQLERERVAALNTANDLWVTEGALGNPWMAVSWEVKEFQLSYDRIAVLDFYNKLHIKEGALDAAWHSHAENVAKFQLDGVRVGVLSYHNTFYAIEGKLDGTWHELGLNIADFDIERDRIAALQTSGKLYIKEGSLTSNSWALISDSVTEFKLNSNRIALLNPLGLFLKPKSIYDDWTLLSNNGNLDFQLSNY